MGDVALWVVIAAAVPGLVAVVLCALLWITLRRLRAAQRVLLPDGTPVGVVDRQASLQRAMDTLQAGLRDVEDLASRRGEVTERGLRSALRFQGLVRYDAYRDMGGQQSWSIALVDGNGSGAVMTSLHARDHARVYLKELHEGVPGQRLSPEEERAVALATGRAPAPALDAPGPEPVPALETSPAATSDPHAPAR